MQIAKKILQKIISICTKMLKSLDNKASKESTVDSKYQQLFGERFYYHHHAAYIGTFKEIFEKEIYLFKPDNETPIIIDCGANMGLSLLFFSKIFPQAIIHAFEPDETVLGVLLKNINTYKMDNVILNKKAVWKENGFLDFYTDNGLGGRVKAEYINQNPKKIEAIRLKEFIGKQVIDMLKMDIEGAEYEVIKDCEPILHQVKNIFVEYHSISNEEQKLDDILFILKRNGFRYHLSQSFSYNKPFVDDYLICERFDMAINIYAYKN